jgi:Protein of unknown function (DUF1218)
VHHKLVIVHVLLLLLQVAILCIFLTISSYFRITFLIAEACLIAGSVRNAYHTKYLGYYTKHDLVTCASLRKGVFAAAAAMTFLSLVFDLTYFWSYTRADTGGWVKHQNEMGVGMTDYGPDVRGREYDDNKGQIGGSRV